jgi:hypothetical protein
LPLTIAEVTIGPLEVRRNGVVDEPANATPVKSPGYGFAVRATDHVEVPDRLGPFGNKREHQTVSGKRLTIGGCHLAAPVIPFVEPGELDPEQCRLKLIKAGIEAGTFIKVFHL